MVHSVCPYCGSNCDGQPNMDDEAQWYAKYHPHLVVGGDVPATCFQCFHVYVIGESVVLRDVPNDAFTVTEIISSPNQPDIIKVRHADGHTRCFAKSQIRPMVDPHIVRSTVDGADRYF